MVRCAMCWLRRSMRAVNLLVNIFGVGMIIYSLWLLKEWQSGVSELPTDLYLPKPWFVHACLGVGIAVCLSTLFGHIIANSTNGSILICINILVLCLLIFVEIAVVVTVFFKIDWVLQLSKYIDDHHKVFESFLIFNICICRLIVIIALVPQTYVIALAIIFWRIRAEPRNTRRSYLNIPDFRQSFLVGPNSPIPGISGHNICCGNVLLINSPTQNRRHRFLPYVIGVFRTHFPSRATEIAD